MFPRLQGLGSCIHKQLVSLRRPGVINKPTTWTEDKTNWIRISPIKTTYTTPPFPNPLTLSPHRTTHNIIQLQQIRLRWASALAQLHGYKILAHNSKKGDVLKMLRFSLVTVAEMTRFGNLEDNFFRIFRFWAKACILGTQKNHLDEMVLLSAQNTYELMDAV